MSWKKSLYKCAPQSWKDKWLIDESKKDRVDIEVIRDLLDAGANINIGTKDTTATRQHCLDDVTPLAHILNYKGNPQNTDRETEDLVTLFIERGANLLDANHPCDSSSIIFSSIIFMACEIHSAEVVRLLLDAAPELAKKKSPEGRTPLEVAQRREGSGLLGKASKVEGRNIVEMLEPDEAVRSMNRKMLEGISDAELEGFLWEEGGPPPPPPTGMRHRGIASYIAIAILLTC